MFIKHFNFTPRIFPCRVYCRIYSDFYYHGWIVLFVFLNSHPVPRCRCVAAACLLPDLSVLAHISRLFRICRILLAFRFLPAVLHRHHHHHHRCHFLPIFCLGRFLVYRSGCRGLRQRYVISPTNQTEMYKLIIVVWLLKPKKSTFGLLRKEFLTNEIITMKPYFLQS